MNYLVLTNSKESIVYAQLLINEILRYDVRAQISTKKNGYIVNYSEDDRELQISSDIGSPKNLEEYSFDLVVVIGSTFSKRLIKRLRQVSERICFFQITMNYDEGYKTFNSSLPFFDKVFVDFLYQINDKVHHVGSYVNDLIRKHDFSLAEDGSLNVAVMISKHKNQAKLKGLRSEMSEEVADCNWYFIEDIESNSYDLTSNNLDLLKHANAVIVDSESASMLAAFMNCPQISLSGKYRLFGFSKTNKLLVNEVLGRDLITSYKPTQKLEINEELNRILNNHEYCATMLTDYQEFKEKVGTNPVARTAVQILMEWLD